MLLIESQISFNYSREENEVNSSLLKSNELIEQNIALKKTIEVLERETNLLKSLLFINSLTSPNSLLNRI